VEVWSGGPGSFFEACAASSPSLFFFCLLSPLPRAGINSSLKRRTPPGRVITLLWSLTFLVHLFFPTNFFFLYLFFASPFSPDGALNVTLPLPLLMRTVFPPSFETDFFFVLLSSFTSGSEDDGAAAPADLRQWVRIA